MRSVARANMKWQGITRINKKPADGKSSFFALNWCKFVN